MSNDQWALKLDPWKKKFNYRTQCGSIVLQMEMYNTLFVSGEVKPRANECVCLSTCMVAFGPMKGASPCNLYLSARRLWCSPSLLDIN